MLPVHRVLPSTDFSGTTSSIGRISALRNTNQCLFNRIVQARLELIRLIALSSIDFLVHLSVAGVQFSVAVVNLPLSSVFGGAASRVAISDSGAHLKRAAKLMMAISVTLILGFMQPDISISLYQRLALVKWPTGIIGCAVHRIKKAVTSTFPSTSCSHLLWSAAVVSAVLVGARGLRPWRLGPVPFTVPPMFWNLSAFAGMFAFSSSGLMSKVCHAGIDHLFGQSLGGFKGQGQREDVQAMPHQTFPSSIPFTTPMSEGMNGNGQSESVSSKPPIFEFRNPSVKKIIQLPTSPLLSLSDDALLNMSTYLNPSDLGKLMGAACRFTQVVIKRRVWKRHCDERAHPIGSHQRRIEQIPNCVRGWADLRLYKLWISIKEPWIDKEISHWPVGEVLKTCALSDGSFATNFIKTRAYIWKTDGNPGRAVDPHAIGRVLTKEGRFTSSTRHSTGPSYGAGPSYEIVYSVNGPVSNVNTFDTYVHKVVPLDDGGFFIIRYNRDFERRDQNGALVESFTHEHEHVDALLNGDLVVACSETKTLEKWDAIKKVWKNLQTDVDVTCIQALTSGGFATASDKVVSIWTSDGTLEHRWIWNASILSSDSDSVILDGGILELSSGDLCISCSGHITSIWKRDGTRVNEVTIPWSQSVKMQRGTGMMADPVDSSFDITPLSGGGFLARKGEWGYHFLDDSMLVARFDLSQEPHPDTKYSRYEGNKFFLPSQDGTLVSLTDRNRPPKHWVPDMEPLITASSQAPKAAETLIGIVFPAMAGKTAVKRKDQ